VYDFSGTFECNETEQDHGENSSPQIIDMTPWIEGKLLLPPQCIINSFLLMDPQQPYKDIDTLHYTPIKVQQPASSSSSSSSSMEMIEIDSYST
jgi:hypothetical protein